GRGGCAPLPRFSPHPHPGRPRPAESVRDRHPPRPRQHHPRDPPRISPPPSSGDPRRPHLVPPSRLQGRFLYHRGGAVLTHPAVQADRAVRAGGARWMKRALPAFSLIILLTIPLWLQDQYILHILITTGIFIIAAMSLNLLLGYTGQLSLGHVAFFGIGAYAS